jgi:hypothetical protein
MLSGNSDRYLPKSKIYELVRKSIKSMLLGRVFTKDTLQKMSLAKKGKPKPDDIAARLRVARKGMTNSQAHRDKCSYALSGRTFSDTAKKNMSLNHADVAGSGNPRARVWLVTDPNGKETVLNGNMGQFCQENNLPVSVMRSIGRGNRPPKSGRCVGWGVSLISDESDIILLRSRTG